MDKIQELTSKLYTEGVEKGKEEAGRIIAEARAQEQQIVDAARTKAKELISSAEKESAELRKNTEAELKLYAAQSTEALKTEIINLVTDKLSTTQVKTVVEDKLFMQQLIVELVQNWSKNDALTIGVENPEELESYIASHAKNLLDNGLKIESVNGIKTGFTLVPEDGSYKVKFGEEEFINYFREFLRPQIQQLLF
ncbi:V/A-type H+-transporting ATPase subunit E [Porphyromonadaceae bacterium NLAE-zl-C104]|nr:V/A-type H+-transporting ATPase subunit E [Porphyromonadaceae bacterium NLAE-zl-C104]